MEEERRSHSASAHRSPPRKLSLLSGDSIDPRKGKERMWERREDESRGEDLLSNDISLDWRNRVCSIRGKEIKG